MRILLRVRTARELLHLLLALLFASLGLLLAATPAAASCICIPAAPAQRVEEADFIFTGVLLSESWGNKRVTRVFSADRVLKGWVLQSERIVTDSSGICVASDLDVGKRYTVFAKQDIFEISPIPCGGIQLGHPDENVVALIKLQPPGWALWTIALGAVLALWQGRTFMWAKLNRKAVP